MPRTRVSMTLFAAVVSGLLLQAGEVIAEPPPTAESSQWEARAQQGDTEALRILAALYANGLGREKDVERAYAYYLQAAEQGDQEACVQLQILIRHGELEDAAAKQAVVERLCQGLGPPSVTAEEPATVGQTVTADAGPSPDLERSLASVLSQYSDPETRATVREMLTRSFGLYPYRENYLLPISYDFVGKDGRRHAEIKFQISVMKPVARNWFGVGEHYFVAYTQQSNWQAYAPSAPFRETNYEPEAFVLFAGSRLPVLNALRFGVNHQSNGQGGDLSRSWNRLYAQGFAQYRQALLSLKAWYRIPERQAKDDNPDIGSYLGHGELAVSWPHKHHFYKLRIRNNLRTDANRGAIQLDWSMPSPFFEHSYFYVQYFNGYGESLIDYDRRVDRLGIGVMWSR